MAEGWDVPRRESYLHVDPVRRTEQSGGSEEKNGGRKKESSSEAKQRDTKASGVSVAQEDKKSGWKSSMDTDTVKGKEKRWTSKAEGVDGQKGVKNEAKQRNSNTSGAPDTKENKESGWTRCSSQDWASAPEFYPAHLGSNKASKDSKTYAEALKSLRYSEEKLCPYEGSNGCTQMGCPFLHHLWCDICNRYCLDPTDEKERKKHESECIKKHERDMEISFAIQRSKDKTCGICFEVIMEKPPWDQKFGILPNCNHCFCLMCIRKWRQVKNFDSKIIRACPECRVSSDFVCPSNYWVDSKEDKEKLISDYKDALSSIDCKYFLQGRGKCPFGNKCFYLHAYPDGTKADVGPPVRQRRQNADGEIEVFQQIFLWDFLEDRDSQWRYSMEDLDDIFAFFSDSDDSDWSDYDFFL